MFLKQITIENVRSLKEIQISFKLPDAKLRKWTLLLGENGTGKSTVLRVVSLLMAGSEALPELLGEPARWVRRGAKSARFAAELVTKDGEERRLEIVLEAGAGIREVFQRNRRGLAELDAALRHAQRNYFTVGYGASRRLPGPGSETFAKLDVFRQPRSQNVASLFSADVALRPLEGWAMDLHYRKGEAGLQVVKQALTDLLPGTTVAGIDRRARRLMFKTPDGLVPLALLSDGYQNMAAWCGDLLYRITETFQDYRKPFNSRGLLLLDEIDLHLHPVWQRQLIAYLTDKLPNIQIIASTHSPLTAQQAGEGELHVLRRTHVDGPPELFQYEGSPRLLRIDQLLVSPIFGLETGASLEVEMKRQRYVALKAKKRLIKNESAEFSRLKTQLKESPPPRAKNPLEQERVALLRSIRSVLGRRAGVKPVAKVETVAQKLKAV